MKVGLIKSSSGVSLFFKQLLKAQWTKALIRLTFHFLEQKDFQYMYRPVKVGSFIY